MPRPVSWLLRAVLGALGLLALPASLPASHLVRSIHLGYPGGEGAAFYNEITVDKSGPGTYFCVCGFRGGYFGIQELGGGKKVVIFSVWDSEATNDPHAIPEDRRVKTLYKDEAVRTGRFGGEGTGGQSFLDYDWKVGETYRCMVTARVEGNRTIYSGHFYLPEKKEWKHLVTFSTLAGGVRLDDYYSFIEDFAGNPEAARSGRKARFGNGWIQRGDGQWVALSRARFTGDSNPRMNINAGVSDNLFYLVTGGDTKNSDTPLWETMKLASPPTTPPELPKAAAGS